MAGTLRFCHPEADRMNPAYEGSSNNSQTIIQMSSWGGQNEPCLRRI